MKKYFKLLALAMAALVVFASCETDEVSTSDGNLWEGELAAAKYASDAVLYNINADGVQSVELTGSGLYFVTPPISGTLDSVRTKCSADDSQRAVPPLMCLKASAP